MGQYLNFEPILVSSRLDYLGEMRGCLLSGKYCLLNQDPTDFINQNATKLLVLHKCSFIYDREGWFDSIAYFRSNCPSFINDRCLDYVKAKFKGDRDFELCIASIEDKFYSYISTQVEVLEQEKVAFRKFKPIFYPSLFINQQLFDYNMSEEFIIEEICSSLNNPPPACKMNELNANFYYSQLPVSTRYYSRIFDSRFEAIRYYILVYLAFMVVNCVNFLVSYLIQKRIFKTRKCEMVTRAIDHYYEELVEGGYYTYNYSSNYAK